MKSRPQLSILMAVHNGLPEVVSAVQSILGQDFADFELVVVDDASTDDLASALFALSCNKLVLLRNAERLGLPRSLLRGWEACCGEYIARLDADDLAYPGRLAAQASFLHENPEVLVVGGCHVEFITEPPTQVEDQAGVEEISFASLLTRNRFCHSAAMFRRAMMANGLAYRPAFARSQDYDLWLRAALCGRICKLRQTVCAYRRSPRSLSLTSVSEQFRYAAWARLLAIERQCTGTDSLDRLGIWPALSAEEENEIKRKSATALVYFSRKMFSAGQVLAGLRLCVRAVACSPVHALAEWINAARG